MNVKVFINGTFDVLHPGHMDILTFAAMSGTQLLVAIDSDERVKELKGPSRPINDQHFRKKMLSHVKGVDEVCVFNTADELKGVIRGYAPDIMIVGSDYINKNVIGSEFSKKLIFFERVSNYSSSDIIRKIRV